MISLLAVICFGVVAFVNYQSSTATIKASEAIIAQAQPSILIAKGQRNINNAIALSVIIMALLIVAMFGFLVSMIIKGSLYEKKLQQHNSNCSNSE